MALKLVIVVGHVYHFACGRTMLYCECDMVLPILHCTYQLYFNHPQMGEGLIQRAMGHLNELLEDEHKAQGFTAPYVSYNIAYKHLQHK